MAARTGRFRDRTTPDISRGFRIKTMDGGRGVARPDYDRLAGMARGSHGGADGRLPTIRSHPVTA
jgi:hypothetical protein